MNENTIIKFDDNNPNSLLFYENDKLIYFLTLPPIKYGCDIINFDDIPLNDGYTYNFDGLVIITNQRERIVYYKGIQLDKIIRCTTKNNNFNIY